MSKCRVRIYFKRPFTFLFLLSNKSWAHFTLTPLTFRTALGGEECWFAAWTKRLSRQDDEVIEKKGIWRQKVRGIDYKLTTAVFEKYKIEAFPNGLPHIHAVYSHFSCRIWRIEPPDLYLQQVRSLFPARRIYISGTLDIEIGHITC